MLFSSLIFIFVFLPLFLLGYYLLPERFRNLYIVVGGYLFYSWGAPRFALILFSTIVIDYLMSLWLVRCPQKHKKSLLIVSVLMNLALLGYFKYSNFFVCQVNVLLDYFHLAAMPWQAVILPIGISFTIFQELSYMIEVYRGNIKPAKTLIDFAAYLMLFPHLIAGPIVRYIDLAGQLEVRVYGVAGFRRGIERFILGLGKKVLLANPLSAVADAMFHLSTVRDLASPLAWLGIVCYALQIYFDFSGYSDMAIGLAKMLGFDFKENFNLPYIATSITDFWRRWHISLSTWMREYVYIPLGGNRVSSARLYFNLWLVFLVSGLWHGASWNFVLWGAFHGCLLAGERLFGLRWLARLPRAIQISLTFVLVNLGWVLFRASDLSAAVQYYGQLLHFSNFFEPLGIRMSEIIDHKQLTVLIFGLLIVFLPSSQLFRKLQDKFASRQLLVSFAYLGLFVVSIMELFNAQFNPFIYFQF